AEHVKAVITASARAVGAGSLKLRGPAKRHLKLFVSSSRQWAHAPAKWSPVRRSEHAQTINPERFPFPGETRNALVGLTRDAYPDAAGRAGRRFRRARLGRAERRRDAVRRPGDADGAGAVRARLCR